MEPLKKSDLYLVSTTNNSPEEVCQNSPTKTFSIGCSSPWGGFGDLIFEVPMDTPKDFKRSEIEDIFAKYSKKRFLLGRFVIKNQVSKLDREYKLKGRKWQRKSPSVIRRVIFLKIMDGLAK